MRTCFEIKLLLHDLAAGRLDRSEHRAVAAHLDDCVDCRAQYDLERIIQADLSSLPVVACPDRVSRRILSRTTAEAQPANSVRSGFLRRRRQWLPTAGLLTAAAVLLVLLLPARDSQTVRPPTPIGTAHETEFVEADESWTPEQVAAARQDALRGLARAARIIDKTERATLNDVFGHRLPATINGSLRSVFADRQGGQG